MAPLRSAWATSTTKNSAFWPLVVRSITHGAILMDWLARCQLERAECSRSPMPAAHTTAMLAAMSKTEQRTDRNRGGITDTQVAFYQAVRTVVNIFAPRVLRRSRVLGSARVSRVGDSESFRESRTSSCRSKSESDVEIHGSDACAPNYSRGLRPWRRSRARPRCRMGSRSGRWSGCRCRRRWLVSERAAEFVHASLAAGAHESA